MTKIRKGHEKEVKTNEINNRKRWRKNEIKKNETKEKLDQETRDWQKGDEGKKEIRSHFGSSFIIGKHFWLWRSPAMKTYSFGFAALSLPSFGSAASANPVNKVVQLLTPWGEDQSRRCRGSQSARRVRCLVQNAIEWSGIRCLKLQVSLFRPRLTISRAVPRQRRQTWRPLPQFVQRNMQTSKNRKRNCWTWSARWEGRSPSSKRSWKEDLRRCNCRGLQRPRGSQCNGAGIVDQFCRRHQTDGAVAKFSEFRWYGRHRRRGRSCCVCVQESQRVHRGDFGGLEIEGRVVACRSSPDWNDSQPQLPDAPTIFGRRLEVQRTGSRSCQTFFGWDAGPVDHRHRRFEDDGRRSCWRYSSTWRYNARLPVKNCGVWGRRQESVWGVGGACEGENRDLREDGRSWILHLRSHSNLVSPVVPVGAFVARRPGQIRSSWRSLHLVLLPRCTPSRQMATILLPRLRVWSARWSRGGRQGVCGRYPQRAFREPGEAKTSTSIFFLKKKEHGKVIFRGKKEVKSNEISNKRSEWQNEIKKTWWKEKWDQETRDGQKGDEDKRKERKTRREQRKKRWRRKEDTKNKRLGKKEREKLWKRRKKRRGESLAKRIKKETMKKSS